MTTVTTTTGMRNNCQPERKAKPRFEQHSIPVCEWHLDQCRDHAIIMWEFGTLSVICHVGRVSVSASDFGRGLIGWARCLLLDDPNGDGWLFRSKKYRGATKGEVLHFHARAHTSTVTRPIAQSIRPSGIYYCCCWLLHSNNNIPEIIKRNKNNNKHSQGNTTNSEVKPTKQPLYISHPS